MDTKDLPINNSPLLTDTAIQNNTAETLTQKVTWQKVLDLFNKNGSAGTYTPTILAVSNIASIVSTVSQYMRVGSVVTVSGFFSGTIASSNTNTEVSISLPIASAFTLSEQAAGASVSSTNSVTRDAAEIQATGGGLVTWKAYPSTNGARGFSYHFTYLVI